MKEKYIKIRHIETGEEMMIDLNEARMKRHAMGFLNYLKINPHFVKHITLTQKVENWKPRILNPFFSSMYKRYGRVCWFWAVESQERGVLHWHILFGFPVGTDFGSEDIKKIQKYWKYGFVSVTPVCRPSMSYLMKYITKALATDIDAKIRRVGSSRFGVWYRQSYRRLMEAISFSSNFGIYIDTFSWFRWTRRGASVQTDDIRYVHRCRDGSLRVFREYIYLLDFKPKWFRIAGYCEDAF